MNARSLALVAAAGIFGAAMLTVPAAEASTQIPADQPVAEATDALDAKDRPVRLDAYDSHTRFLPKIGKAHDYRASMAPGFWSVVALRSPINGDMDLELFADKAHTKSLGRSAFGTAISDFIAVDRSLAPYQEVFPQVQAYSGNPGEGHTYTVELAQGQDTLGSKSKTIPVQNENSVRVYDSYLAAGVTYTFVLDSTGPYADGDLFLVGSTPGDPSSGVQRRIDALEVGAAQGSGGTETITYTPSVSDYYGVVVLSGGFGSYTLTRTN
jgi:hypothetical protein